MKILQLQWLQLQKEGRLTLQIPCGFIGVPPPGPAIDMPDDWFVELRLGSYRLTTGKETGYLFLSEKGYNANKDVICEAYAIGPYRGGEHQQEHEARKTAFDAYATTFYQQIRTATAKHVKELQKKAQDLQAKLNVF